MTEVLVFEVAGHRYGLEARDVREIVRAAAVVPLPRAPEIVEGVVNVRGRVIPVLDLRRRFGLERRDPSPSDHFVVADAREYVVALRADRVLDFVRVRAADVADAKRVLPESEYVAGVAKLKDGLVLLHDVRTFLSGEEVAALAEPLAGAAPRDVEVGAGARTDEDARLELVVASVAGARYALETKHVWRVIAAPEITPVPSAPDILVGVTNFQGDVLPVFDARRVLALSGASADAWVVVVGVDRPDLGLAVDSVDEVIELPCARVLDATDALASAARALARGVAADGLVVLDGAKLIDDPRMTIEPHAGAQRRTGRAGIGGASVPEA